MTYTEKKRTKFLGLPIYFTTYVVAEEKLTIKSGFLTLTEDDAYMYKIQDVRLTKSFLERVFKLGTIICYTGDTTHPELKLQHIRNAYDVKEFIIEQSELARRKRRTMNTLDIDAEKIEDDMDSI